MKKRWRGAILAAVLGLALAGCGGGQETGGASSGTAAADGTERKEFTIVYSAELAHINYLKSSLNTCTRFVENQDPMASLNERAKVDYIVSEGLYNLHKFKSEAERKEIVSKALLDVGLLPEFASRFPHEFSGGQRQRIGIARALVMEPKLIIADEPISALDVSIRAQVLNLLSELQKKKGFTYLFIAHDLSIVRFISDRVAVIHKGKIVELAETEKLYSHPLHPYTRALLSAIPQPDPLTERVKKVEVYDPSCHHYETDKPRWIEIEEGHFVLANQEEEEKYQEVLRRS